MPDGGALNRQDLDRAGADTMQLLGKGCPYKPGKICRVLTASAGLVTARKTAAHSVCWADCGWAEVRHAARSAHFGTG